MANDYTVEPGWGPLLLRAFPDGNATEAVLTDAQRQLLTAIADKDDCWGNIETRSHGCAKPDCRPSATPSAPF
ncbi:hypothetical protein [Streptacidiphilus sp. MAP12-16]|uniref:hypothetical protein n=1 Tax=Streptacidiphilus sp. MAP12-16 TaxID=3156300 RepID=UPI003518AC13